MPLGGVGTLERYSAYPAVFDALEIPDIIDTDTQFGINEIEEMAAGNLDLDEAAVANLEPAFMLNCLNLAHLATISPTVGLHVDGQSLIQHQRRADGGTWSGSGHLLIKAMQGFLCPVSIEASQDSNQAARMNLKFWVEDNGTDLFLEILTDTLTSEDGPLISTMFRLAKTTVNGISVGGNQSTKIDFGIDYRVTRANGELVGRVGGIYNRRPVITIEPKNLQGFLAITGGSMVRLAGNVVCYFKKEGVANNVAEHISVTLTQPTGRIGNIAANANDDPRPAVIFRATRRSTIAVSTTATIA